MTTETKIIFGISIATLLIIVVGAIVFTKGTPTGQVADQKHLIKPTSYSQGSKTAKVQLVEFGDYQCPACGAAYPTVKQLQSDFGQNLQLIFRNFPLRSVHPNAEISALAAEAAGAQGKYFDMHDLLYQQQREWANEKDPLPFFQKYAKTLHLNVDKFTSDIKNQTYLSRIQDDTNDGVALSINSTPTFFINGIRDTDPTYDYLKNEIKTTLQQK